jgi:O-antigen biosynthesis protein
MSSPRTGRVIELALDLKPLRPPEIGPHEMAYIVLRHRGRAVGRLLVDGSRGPHGMALLAEARALAAEGIAAADAESGVVRLAAGPAAAAVSVVIATRNRPDDLRSCLAAVRAQIPAPGEIVVADSASDDPAQVAVIAREAGARLVRCDRAGLSRARNAGASAARGAVLAFLDDDCRADAGWLAGIVHGFEDAGVDAVTGSFAPSELATWPQILFLEYAHMDRRGALPRRFTRSRAESRHWPLDAWRMGSGGNLAIRAEAFRARGGFRPDLGLGTPALGGEDLYLLWSTIHAGRDVVYRSDAMAWHRHHRGLDALRRVMFGYGAGHAAFVRAAVRAGAPKARAVVYVASFWYDRLKRLGRALLTGRPARVGLVLREAAGMLAGMRLGRRAERELP